MPIPLGGRKSRMLARWQRHGAGAFAEINANLESLASLLHDDLQREQSAQPSEHNTPAACDYESTRPSAAPRATATKPNTRLVATYSSAIQNAPLLRFENISHSNVEKVEYAPMKPMGIR